MRDIQYVIFIITFFYVVKISNVLKASKIKRQVESLKHGMCR